MRLKLLATLLCVVLAQPCAGGPAPEPAGVAIVGATVLPMTGSAALADQTVLVAGDRIVKVGRRDATRVPAGYRRIDGRGRFLMPGLVDMHVHLANEPGRPGDAAQRALAVMLAHGVTTVRSMAGGANHIALRDAVERGTIPGPRIYAASPALNVNSVASADAARAAVRSAKAAGFDLIKSRHLPDLAVWEAVQDEAKRQGLPVAGHVTNEVTLPRALAAREEVEHLDGAVQALLPESERGASFGQIPPPPVLQEVAAMPDARYREVAAMVAGSRVYQVPTLGLFEQISDVTTPTEVLARRPEMRFVPPQVLAAWSQQRGQLAEAGFTAEDGERLRSVRRRLARAYYEAGVPLMAGSDTAQAFHLWGPGLLREVDTLGAAGLPPLAALKAATVNPRDYLRSLPNGGSSLGWKAEFGTIEPGARADLILLEADPLKDLGALRRLAAVIAAGRFYDRAALDALLDKAAADAGGPATPAPVRVSDSCGLAGVPAGTRCGSVEVPENRSVAGGRMLSIRYAVIPAEKQPAGAPIVVLPGGPGIGGVQQAAGIAQLFADFRADRDILLIDQRGTGGSNRLDCPRGEQSNPLGPLGGTPPEEVKACRAALETRADLARYGTREAVLDMEAVRARLGYPKLDLFGMSYGTRVALDYLRLFADHVDRTVIRAAAPASMLLPFWTPRDSQGAFDTLAEACTRQPDCAARHPDLRADLRRVVARLDAGPVSIHLVDPKTGRAIDGKLDREGFGSVLFFLLYIPQFYVHVPPLVEKAAAGDFSPIVQAAAPALLGTTDEVAWGMRWSVICDEDVRRIEAGRIAAATAGTFMGEGALRNEIRACGLWPKSAMPADYPAPVRSDKPVLILSGNMDPVAGPRWGEEIARTLPNSRHLVAVGASHLPPLPGCTGRIMKAFLSGTEPRALDAACLGSETMPPLQP